MFLNFYKIFFNRFGSIPPQNRNTEVASVQKICLIKLFLATLQLKSSEWLVGNTGGCNIIFPYSANNKQRTTNQFLVSATFFANMNISFLNLCLDLFSMIAKKIHQIRNNMVCVLAPLVFVFCCALTTSYCNAFHHSFINQKKSEFCGPSF